MRVPDCIASELRGNRGRVTWSAEPCGCVAKSLTRAGLRLHIATSARISVSVPRNLVVWPQAEPHPKASAHRNVTKQEIGRKFLRALNPLFASGHARKGYRIGGM